jgi:hypothetical protein
LDQSGIVETDGKVFTVKKSERELTVLEGGNEIKYPLFLYPDLRSFNPENPEDGKEILKVLRYL